ncbi:MAG: SDR family oxidoreductase, partial [Dehalococcoidales bacterium]|nr:SDR family oxidoreductase [Dehalococcoidales bacterium]
MSIVDFSLAGRVALVTGGKSGIGRAISLAMAEAGADVAICSRTLADGELVGVADEIRGKGRRALAVRANISSSTDVADLVAAVMKEFGRIDIMVNNAGNYLRIPLLEMSEEDWDSIINTHLKGCYFCCQAAGKIMVAQKKGNIINIASTLGHDPRPMVGAYAAAKSGILAMTRVLAMELAPYNVRVNAISPSLVKTRLTERVRNDDDF